MPVLLLIAALFFSTTPLLAQKQELTLDVILRSPGSFFPRTLHGLQWLPSGLEYSWVGRVPKANPPRISLFVADVQSGRSREVLSFEAAKAALEGVGAKRLSPSDLIGMRWNADGSLGLALGASHYRLDLNPLRASRRFVLPEGASELHFSPDGEQLAFIVEHDLYLIGRDGVTRRITRDGHDDLRYGQAVSRSEFGISEGIFWSPDGRRLAVYREDLRPIARYPYTDFTTVPATAKRGRYPMAGRAGSIVRVGVYDTRSESLSWLPTDDRADEYLACLSWRPDGEALSIAHINRGQDAMVLREWALGEKANSRVLLEEKDAEWIEPEAGAIYLEDGSGRFLWFSFANGWRHLWLHDAAGKQLKDLTPGAFDVESFVGFAPDGGRFFVQASGVDPRQHHLFAGSLDGAFERLTPKGGHHECQLSPSGAHFLDRHSSLHHPEAVTLRPLGKGKERPLARTRSPLERFRLGEHRFFTTKTRDGKGTLYGHLMLPPKDVPTKGAPVIQYVYGGPHSQLVQDRWLGSQSRWILWQMMMASKGYVVFRVDGRGTKNRGIEWQQAIHRQLGTLELDDQLAGLDAVLKETEADPKRVGVHGWSYGGFMTLTMMTRGKAWHAGVAGAPVTDWSFYETGYGERYMDTPKENPDGYATSNPGTHVAGLAGKELLVVHPLADSTVMWQSSVDFLRRCVSAGAPVEFMTYPEMPHGLSGPSYDHFLRKMTAWFERTLSAR